MRTGTLAAILLFLLLACSAAIAATNEPAGDVSYAPRPLSDDPLGADLVPTPEPSITPSDACHTADSPCVQCGGRRCNAECGQVAFGAAVSAAMKTQICNGLGTQMVLYHYDFCDATGPNGSKLNGHGMARLLDIARMFPCSNFHPIVIEYTRCNATLDDARRRYVLNTLSQINVSIPEHLVVVGKPKTPGLSGREAVLLDKTLLERTQGEGQNPPPTPSVQDTSSGQSGMQMSTGQ